VDNCERFVATLNGEKPDRILTYDFCDNEELLVKFGGYDKSKTYELDELVHVNVKAFKSVGLDVTRSIHDPANDWMGMGDKITNWVRFFGVDPDNWEITRKGGTTWISKRPFTDLKGLEKHMPNPPKFEEVAEWYMPLIKYAKEVFDENDLVFIGAAEGPITDTLPKRFLEEPTTEGARLNADQLDTMLTEYNAIRARATTQGPGSTGRQSITGEEPNGGGHE